MLDTPAQGSEGSPVPPSEVKTQTNEVKPAGLDQTVKPPQVSEQQPEAQSSSEAALAEQAVADRLAQQAKQELPPPVVPQVSEVQPAPIALNQERMERGSPTKGPLTGKLISFQHQRRAELAARHGQSERTELRQAA